MFNQRPTVLVIEDEKSLLKAWVQNFEQAGFKVLTATNSDTALLAAFRNHPDLIVVDVVMPSSDGLIIIKKLREDKWGNNVPVMFLSSWQDPQMLPQMASANDEHLGSNWSLSQVVRRVGQKLEVMRMGLA